MPKQENPKKQKREKKVFDSYAEELYYEREVQPRMLSGEIESADMHKEFEILPAVEAAGAVCRAKKYTPDFILHYADGRTEVVEIKGTKIKRLQRDFELRKHIFIISVCMPRGWSYRQIKAEDITGGSGT